MNPKHRKTLAALFAKEIPKNLPFRDIESLLRAIGCEIIEGSGSRVKFEKHDKDWTTHRPHPGKISYIRHVKGAREFLEQLKVKP